MSELDEAQMETLERILGEPEIYLNDLDDATLKVDTER